MTTITTSSSSSAIITITTAVATTTTPITTVTAAATETVTPTATTIKTNASNCNKQRSAYWRNKPQSNAISGGSLIFLSGGMNLAQSLGWNQFSIEATKYFHSCWFIGVIIGCLITIPLAMKLTKKYCMFASALLIFCDGIIFVWIPDTYNALIVARYLNGIAIGITWPIYLKYASEITVNSYRGICITLEQYYLTIGICIQIIYITQWNYDEFNVNYLHGIFDILFAVLSFLCNYVWYIESPITHLLQHDELAALNCLASLEQPRGITNKKRLLLEEHKLYIKEANVPDNIKMYILKNVLWPLSKLLLLRCLIVTFSFSLPLTIAIQFSTLLSVGWQSWPLILYATLRALGSLFTIFTIDTIGRRFITIFGVLILGSLLIGIGVILATSTNLLDHHEMAIVCTLSLLIQYFGGLLTPNISAYMSEAFPLKFKLYLLSICIIIEQCVQIIIILFVKNTTEFLYKYFLTTGSLCIILFPLFYLVIPETRKCSLHEAQNRFHNYLNKKLW